jgi:hypothetical protein
VVLRGDGWNYDYRGVRCADRLGDLPNRSNGDVGFRVVVHP